MHALWRRVFGRPPSALQATGMAVVDRMTAAEAVALMDGLDAHSALHGAAARFLGVLDRDGGRVRAGLASFTMHGALFIRHLWVVPERRGRGVGRALMALAEREAVQRGCTQACVDTFSFCAPEFYPKLGYEEVARLGGLGPTGADCRHWFVKRLPVPEGAPACDRSSP